MGERARCRKYCRYKLQDLGQVEQFLEKKAQEGWIVYKHLGGWFSFEKGEPRNIRYYVEVFEKERWNNSYQNAVNQAFIKANEKKGWKFVDADSRFQILRSDNPNAKKPSILMSDKIKSIYKSCFLEYRYLFVCLLLMSLFNMIFGFSGTVQMLASFSRLLYELAWITVSGLLIGYVISERRWYQQALAVSSKENGVPENPRHRYLYITLISAIILLMLSVIGFFIESNTYSSGSAFTRCLILLGIVSLSLIVVIIRDNKRACKMGVIIGLVVVLSDIAVYGIGIKFSSIFEKVHTVRSENSKMIYADELPITLTSLGIKRTEGITYSTYHEVKGEFLIQEEYYSEEPVGPLNLTTPSFWYQVYRTGGDYLYKRILSEECFEKDKEEEYEEVKVGSYPAEKIRKKKMDTGYYEYIFEFEHQIIKMNINVELSKEQLQKIMPL